jgi:nucleoside transporter
MGFGLRLNLSVMMFLQFAIWGAWFTVLGNYLGHIGFDKWIGSIYGTMALGTIFAPLVVGQIADRFMPSQILMAIFHLAGAGLLYLMSQITPQSASNINIAFLPEDNVERSAHLFWYAALLYALVYSPTLALSNTVAFTHVPNGQRDFPGIRVFGTIGWIAAGMAVGMLIPKYADQLSAWTKLPLAEFKDPKITNVPIMFAACLSALLGIWSLILPHTPPKGRAGDAIPFLRAMGLLAHPSFAVFFGVSFIITIVLAFYYGFTGLWLEKKIGVVDVASTMTIGQWSEMLLLPFLPFFLWKFGMKWVLVIGMAAWGIRYYLFSIAQPDWQTVNVPWHDGKSFVMTPINPIILTLAFHGVCYDFFFAAAFIHVDNESPHDIRGSAQALFTFLTYGLGMWLGNVLSGKLSFAVSHELKNESGWQSYLKLMFTDFRPDDPNLVTKATDWQIFWTVPAVGVLVSMLFFVLFFRLKPTVAD